TVLYVSHDRYFVNQTADRILELKADGIHEYLGNYDYYLQKRDDIKSDYGLSSDVKEEETEENIQAGSALDWKKQKEEARARQKKEREIKSIEDRIEKLESKKDEINSQFEDPEIAKNSAKLNDLTGQFNALEEELKKLYHSWEELSEAIDG
ncbi:MAG: ABC transporter ATP-binding protein, partial [Candidatus Weimeria sp.]